jgi:carbamoyltransferase
MNLPSIALHSWHNASVAVYHKNDITCIVEFERLIGLKNASYEHFEPIRCKEYILKEVYNYLKDRFGYTQYDKFIIGYGYSEVPLHYKNTIPANEYIIDEGHHTAHACNSFYQSPYHEALIVSFDGGSNDGWFNIYKGVRGEELQHLHYKDYNLGQQYHHIGLYCDEIKNYHNLTAAGKVLGLQSYGKVIDEWKEPLRKFFTVHPYSALSVETFLELKNSIGIDFDATNKLKEENSYNFARTAQEVFEELFFEVVDPFVAQYSNLPVIITGGCALNITLNTKAKKKYNQDIFVAPNSSDCGLTTGLLLKHFKPQHVIDVTYKGVDVLDKNMLMEYVHEREGSVIQNEQIVDDLIEGKILGVVQNTSEHGPRALGNRSIICSALLLNMKDILNAKVKHREWYRPFAPIVRLEDVSEYFHWNEESRWMNFCVDVKEEYKDLLPAITHVDGTARVQTITKEQNPFIYDLLTLFKEKTGIGVLVNTSFNVDGKPILSTYKDAFKVFDETELDRLYLDGFYFNK